MKKFASKIVLLALVASTIFGFTATWLTQNVLAAPAGSMTGTALSVLINETKAINPITITDLGGEITTGNGIQITFNSLTNAEWDSSDTTATIDVTGNATGAVSTAVTYTQADGVTACGAGIDCKILFLTVTSDFTSGDSVTISGLSVVGGPQPSIVRGFRWSVDGGVSFGFSGTATITVVSYGAKATSADVGNEVPAFFAGPSDGGSSASNPTDAGDYVTFTTTATDSNGDDYYLLICSSVEGGTGTTAPGNPTAGNPPTCNAAAFEQFAVSSATPQNTEASVDFLSTYGKGTQNWFAYVCDPNNCNDTPAVVGTGVNDSPFVVDDHIPAFTIHTTDNGSDVTSPTNVGSEVTFNATATDAGGDEYYLIICTSADVTPHFDAAPTCTETTWAVSSATVSGQEATATHFAVPGDFWENDWYAFVCDKNTVAGGGKCSIADTPADPDSYFYVNHAPTFGTVLVGSATGGTGSIVPGDTVYFHLNQGSGTNGIYDFDNDSVTQTVRAYICNPSSTGVDLGTNLCTGVSPITYCAQTIPFEPNFNDFECSSPSIAAIPTADGSYNFNIFVYDEFDFAGTGTIPQSYSVDNVLPYIQNSTDYSVTDINLSAGSGTEATYSVIITDDNGDTDIDSNSGSYLTNGVLYHDETINLDGIGDCTGSELDCYHPDVTCVLSDNTGYSAPGVGGAASSQATFTCHFLVFYNADDTNGETDRWAFHVNPADGNGYNYTTLQSDTIAVNSLAALNISETNIAYSSVSLDTVSTTTPETTIQNFGNQVIDTLITGTDMTGAGTIASIWQKWSDDLAINWETGGADEWALLNDVTGGPNPADGCSDRNLPVRTTSGCADVVCAGALTVQGGVDQVLYWKIKIPPAVPAGAYSGINTFTSTIDSTCTGLH